MIRAAKFADVPRIVELMIEMQSVSKYRDVSDVDEREAHHLAASCIQRNGHTTSGGAWVQVVERDGVVEGFMIGLLDRVYHIGKKLTAIDLFLYCSPRAPKTAMPTLVNGYLAWAENNPRVATIKASWTDAVPGAERMSGLYARKGLTKIGEIFEKNVATPVALGIAA